jgi:peptide/nickel transport system permease protein
MIEYIFNRIALMIPTLLGIALITFVMIRIVPGDVVELKMRADGGRVTQQQINDERTRLGLDRPLPEQFMVWMKGIVTFDFGYSMWTGRPVAQEIGDRIGLSIQVAIMATVIALIIAIPLGTISALFRDSMIDYTFRLITIAGLAVPSFWLGMIIILVLLTYFKWSPPVTYISVFEDPVKNISQLIWPALAVGYRYAAVVARMIRSSIIEVMQEDYIRTARAKGITEFVVVLKHAMRNALLPAVTIIGLEFAFLIGGLVVTEQVFNLNGIGRLFVDAVIRHDFILIQTIVFLLAVIFLSVNLIVDLIYGFLDPRTRM